MVPAWTLWVAAGGTGLQLVGVLLLAIDVWHQRKRARERNARVHPSTVAATTEIGTPGIAGARRVVPPVEERLDGIERRLAELEKTIPEVVNDAVARTEDEAFKMTEGLRADLEALLRTGLNFRNPGAILVLVGTALVAAGAIGLLVAELA